MVPKAGKFFGRPLNMDRGVKQGDPVSLTISNIVVGTVVRAVLLEGWRVSTTSVFLDDRRISGRNLFWVQTALTFMVRMFGRLVLQKNLIKINSMVCTLGFIWEQQGVDA